MGGEQHYPLAGGQGGIHGLRSLYLADETEGARQRPQPEWPELQERLAQGMKMRSQEPPPLHRGVLRKGNLQIAAGDPARPRYQYPGKVPQPVGKTEARPPRQARGKVHERHGGAGSETLPKAW